MSYALSQHSLNELNNVHPDLVEMVKRAIKVTPVDFMVHDGIRTVEEQRQYVDKGVSWTMDSKHLPQKNGYGMAVDLVPYIGGKPRWEWEPIYKIADTVRSVAQGQGIRIRWGGCWSELTGTCKAPKELVSDYVDKRRSQGRDATPDGPHMELLIPSKQCPEQ